jgi:eukaryotic-like serine/threonine-protein kinase
MDIGSVISDRYRLVERIATGGVGQVWRAEDLALKRVVAVKVLRPEYAGNNDVLGRFRGEARHAGALTHPGIARVYDYGEAADAPYLVMEFVDGPSLAELLDGGPLDPARTADVIAQAADALDAAHRMGVVHRDVKPGNLLIGPGGHLKITDFGIAYAIGSAPVTDLGIVVGTAAYLAPERAAGASGSPSSDLYSLGIVGYECAAGYPPFGGTQAEIMASHLYSPLPPLPGEVPAGLADLIARLTAKDPRVRPADAAQVSEFAFRIRDEIVSGVSGVSGTELLPPGPGTGRNSSPPTVLDYPPDVPTAAYDEGGTRAGRSRRRGLTAALAACVVAGLGGWLVSSMLSGSSAPAHAAAVSKSSPSPSASASTISTSNLVRVDAKSLIGLPVNTVLGRLHALKLQPLLKWTPNGSVAAGTVTSIAPNGAVSAGSQIVVTAAYEPGTSPSAAASSAHASAPPTSPSATQTTSSAPTHPSSPASSTATTPATTPSSSSSGPSCVILCF